MSYVARNVHGVDFWTNNIFKDNLLGIETKVQEEHEIKEAGSVQNNFIIPKMKELSHNVIIKWTNQYYASFADYREFLIFYEKVPQENKNFYEVVPDDKQFLFADLDAESGFYEFDEKNNEINEFDIIRLFLDVFKKALEYIGFEFDAKQCIFLSATQASSQKFSLHFIYCGVVVSGCEIQKSFWGLVNSFINNDARFEDLILMKRYKISGKDEYDNILSSFIDMKVYSKLRAFRILGSSKEGQARPLREIVILNDRIEYTDQPTRAPTDYFIYRHEYSGNIYNGPIPKFEEIATEKINENDFIKKCLECPALENSIYEKPIIKHTRTYAFKNINPRECYLSGYLHGVQDNKNRGYPCYVTRRHDGAYFSCLRSECVEEWKKNPDNITQSKYKKLFSLTFNKKIIMDDLPFNKLSGFVWRDFDNFITGQTFSSYLNMKSQIMRKLPSVFALIGPVSCVIKNSNNPDNLNNFEEFYKFMPNWKFTKNILIKYEEFGKPPGRQKKNEEKITKKIREISLFDFIKHERNIIPKYDYFTLDPLDKKHAGVFNIYPGLISEHKTETKGHNLDMVLNLIYEVLADSNPEIYKWLLAWFKHLLFNTGQTAQTALVLFSHSFGVGKGMFMDFLGQYVIGNDLYILLKDLDRLGDAFNSGVTGKRLLFIDEVSSSGNSGFRNRWDALKSKITEKTDILNKKYMELVKIRNYACYVFATNHIDAIYMDQHERRYMILKCSEKYLQNLNYFANFQKSCLNYETGRAFYEFIGSLSDDKLPRILVKMETPGLIEMLEYAKGGVECFVDEIKEYAENNKEIRRYFKTYNLNDEMRTTEFADEYNKWAAQNNQRTGVRAQRVTIALIKYLGNNNIQWVRNSPKIKIFHLNTFAPKHSESEINIIHEQDRKTIDLQLCI